MKPRSFITTFCLLAAIPLIGCGPRSSSPAAADSNSNLTGDGAQVSARTSSPGNSSSNSPAKPATGNRIQLGNSTGTPSFSFEGSRFELVTQNQWVNQYIPVGQTLDDWEAMFVVRRFPELSSPQEAIDNIMENLKAQNADNRLVSVKTGSQPDTEVAIDFVIWTPDQTLTEFNIHIYKRTDDGMMANMYLMRGYETTGHNELTAMVVQNRKSILDSVFYSTFPPFLFPKKQR